MARLGLSRGLGLRFRASEGGIAAIAGDDEGHAIGQRDLLQHGMNAVQQFRPLVDRIERRADHDCDGRGPPDRAPRKGLL